MTTSYAVNATVGTGTKVHLATKTPSRLLTFCGAGTQFSPVFEVGDQVNCTKCQTWITKHEI